MENKITEPEAKAILRELGRKSKAEAILASPAQPKVLALICMIGATLLAQYALKESDPDLTRALLLGAFVGLAVTGAELWSVR
jgi:hypothetical protein